MKHSFVVAGGFLFIACQLTGTTVYAQKNKVSFDLSLLKFGTEIGVDQSTVYRGPVLLFNALKIGYGCTQKGNVRAGIRRQPGRYLPGKGNSTAQMSNRGLEVTLGYEYTIRVDSSLSLLPELGIFYDYARLQGDAAVRGSQTMVPVNHERQYKGIYPEMKVAYQVSKHISIIAGTRLRIGSVKSAHVQVENSYPAFQPSKGYAVTFDPTSTVSFRYTL